MQSLAPLSPDAHVTAVNNHFEQSIPCLLTFEFTRDRKMMSVLVKLNGSGVLFVKGAPESILERCKSVLVNGNTSPLTPNIKKALLDCTLAYGSQALRTLAFAYVNVQDIDVAHYLSESSK